jgi:hypothetical protein
MSRFNRALIPALILAGTLFSLTPVAQAGSSPWTAHGYSQGNYGSRSNYYQGGRDERDYRDRRAPPVYNYRNDYSRYGNERSYQYQRYQGYQGYQSYPRYQSYPSYRGYGGYDGRSSYRGGRCNTDGALTVMGAVTGGIIGSRAASPRDRGASTVVGAIAGGILGNVIGSSIDGGNRGCY